jgi:hypothetical protein
MNMLKNINDNYKLFFKTCQLLKLFTMNEHA